MAPTPTVDWNHGTDIARERRTPGGLRRRDRGEARSDPAVHGQRQCSGATAEVVSLVHGDPNPEGPGVKEVVMDWGPGEAGLRRQEIDFGSYIEIASQEELTPSSDFTVDSGCIRRF